MKNAHLRMAKLTFVRQTRDTVTNISIHLHRLVAERPPEPHAPAQLHLVSAFGGDQEIGATVAAALEGLRFQIAVGGEEFIGGLGEKPAIYRSSLQVPGRKRPVRHIVLLSRELMETTLGANGEARRTVLFDEQADFVLHRLSVRFGMPVLPEWGEWFRTELDRRRLIEPIFGWNCSPVVVKGTKLRMLRVLSQGLKRRSIQVPDEGSWDVPSS
jgi:hypothetical protein